MQLTNQLTSKSSKHLLPTQRLSNRPAVKVTPWTCCHCDNWPLYLCQLADWIRNVNLLTFQSVIQSKTYNWTDQPRHYLIDLTDWLADQQLGSQRQWTDKLAKGPLQTSQKPMKRRTFLLRTPPSPVKRTQQRTSGFKLHRIQWRCSEDVLGQAHEQLTILMSPSSLQDLLPMIRSDFDTTYERREWSETH